MLLWKSGIVHSLHLAFTFSTELTTTHHSSQKTHHSLLVRARYGVIFVSWKFGVCSFHLHHLRAVYKPTIVLYRTAMYRKPTFQVPTELITILWEVRPDNNREANGPTTSTPQGNFIVIWKYGIKKHMRCASRPMCYLTANRSVHFKNWKKKKKKKPPPPSDRVIFIILKDINIRKYTWSLVTRIVGGI